MADFNIAVAKTLIREGGSKITDDPTDKGGLTKYGISQRAYPKEDIRNLSEDRAKELYKRDYWDKVQGDQIKSQNIAEAIFDTAVNMGAGMAVKLAQWAMGMDADGVMGPKTLQLIHIYCENSDAEGLFLARYKLAKIARYIDICKKNDSQRRFLVGWISRTLEA